MALSAIHEREYGLLLMQLSTMDFDDPLRISSEKELRRVKHRYNRFAGEFGDAIEAYREVAVKIRRNKDMKCLADLAVLD